MKWVVKVPISLPIEDETNWVYCCETKYIDSMDDFKIPIYDIKFFDTKEEAEEWSQGWKIKRIEQVDPKRWDVDNANIS